MNFHARFLIPAAYLVEWPQIYHKYLAVKRLEN